MAKGPSTKAILILMLVCVGGVGALAWYVKKDGAVPFASSGPGVTDEGPQVQIERPKPSEAPPEVGAGPAQKHEVVLPVIRESKLTSETKAIEVPDGEDPKAFLTEQIVKAVNLDHARVLGVDVRNGTAVINFGNGIDDGMSSEQEGLFLTSLQRAFSQFPEVKNLELDKEGEKLESVGGHIDLTDGLPVTSFSSPPPSGPKPSEPSGPTSGR